MPTRSNQLKQQWKLVNKQANKPNIKQEDTINFHQNKRSTLNSSSKMTGIIQKTFQSFWGQWISWHRIPYYFFRHIYLVYFPKRNVYDTCPAFLFGENPVLANALSTQKQVACSQLSIIWSPIDIRVSAGTMHAYMCRNESMVCLCIPRKRHTHYNVQEEPEHQCERGSIFRQSRQWVPIRFSAPLEIHNNNRKVQSTHSPRTYISRFSNALTNLM